MAVKRSTNPSLITSHERELQVYFDEIRVGDSMQEVDPFRSGSHDDLKTHAGRYSIEPVVPWKEWAMSSDAKTRG